MKPKAAKSIIKEVLRTLQRPYYASNSGVYLLSSSGATFHHFLVSKYRISSIGPFFPRWTINGTPNSAPAHIARALGCGKTSCESYCALRLEITVRESEMEAVASALPAIVNHIEAGNREGFEPLLPFQVVNTTETNLWSKAADDQARAENPSFIRQRRILAMAAKEL